MECNNNVFLTLYRFFIIKQLLNWLATSQVMEHTKIALFSFLQYSEYPSMQIAGLENRKCNTFQ